MLRDRFLLAARVTIALAGASSMWLFLVNRIVIQWVDGIVKSATMAALLLLVAATAIVPPLRFPAVRWTRGWLLLLLVFGAGEARRAWLRHVYHADSESRVDIWHPVTTTDLLVRRFSVEVPGLASDRVRVLHLTDLHVTKAEASYVDRAHQMMREIDPDLIVMSGDYLSRADRLPVLVKWLEGMPRVRLGAYAVLGNHDYWAGDPEGVRRALSLAGVRVMGGSCEDIAVSSTSNLRVCGTEEPWGRGYEEASSDEVAATLVLSHTPDNVYAIAQHGATAVFAGHTHGGQFRIPTLGALVVPSDYGRRFDEGHFLVGGTHLFVSSGIGADAPQLRLWCPPELIVVDLEGGGGGEHRGS